MGAAHRQAHEERRLTASSGVPCAKHYGTPCVLAMLAPRAPDDGRRPFSDALLIRVLQDVDVHVPPEDCGTPAPLRTVAWSPQRFGPDSARVSCPFATDH